VKHGIKPGPIKYVERQRKTTLLFSNIFTNPNTPCLVPISMLVTVRKGGLYTVSGLTPVNGQR